MLPRQEYSKKIKRVKSKAMGTRALAGNVSVTRREGKAVGACWGTFLEKPLELVGYGLQT